MVVVHRFSHRLTNAPVPLMQYVLDVVQSVPSAD